MGAGSAGRFLNPCNTPVFGKVGVSAGEDDDENEQDGRLVPEDECEVEDEHDFKKLSKTFVSLRLCGESFS